MNGPRQWAFVIFYENLAKEQMDIDYYLNPIGLSRRKAIVSLVLARPGDTVVDLGCGDGLVAIKLQRKTHRVMGCDLSPTRARRARSNGIEALCADARQLPYHDASFDWAVCSEVIEHVSDPRSILTQTWNVLRPGGAAVFTVPLGEHLEQTLLDVPEDTLSTAGYLEIKDTYHLKNSHLSSFTTESFLDLVKDVGFSVESTSFTYNHAPRSPFLFRNAKRIYRVLTGRRSASLFSRWIEFLVCPVIRLSHRKEDGKHHIVVLARKPSPER